MLVQRTCTFSVRQVAQHTGHSDVPGHLGKDDDDGRQTNTGTSEDPFYISSGKVRTASPSHSNVRANQNPSLYGSIFQRAQGSYAYHMQKRSSGSVHRSTVDVINNWGSTYVVIAGPPSHRALRYGN